MPSQNSFAVRSSGKTTTNPANITAGTVLAHTFSAPGATTVNGGVVVNFPSLETNVCQVGARVTAAGTIEVRLYNPTGGDINPASQDVIWAVF